MKRHGHLFEQITAFDNLLLAAHKARRGKQARKSVARFFFHLESELFTLQEELQSGTYRMRPYHTFTIFEPKQRQICAARFRDRVVHHAICNVLDPIFEASLISDTYACRRGKGTHAAVKRAQHFSRHMPYVLTCDIRKYFDSVDHAALKTLLRRKIKDQRLLTLLSQIIDQPIPGGILGKGLPIGNLTSQYFANLYLGELDHFVKERLCLKGYVRYMDDFLVFAEDKKRLRTHLAAIRTFLASSLFLSLKESAIRVAPTLQGIPFLGFCLFPGMLRMQQKKWRQFRHRVRTLEAQYTSGLIDEPTLAQSVDSMIAHIRHCNSLSARRNFFANSLS